MTTWLNQLAPHWGGTMLPAAWQSSLVALVLLVVWWFNPVFWLLGRWVRKVREDCCDDLLLARELTTSDTYCETLVHTGRELTHALPAGAVLGFAESTHPLTRRLRRIMDANLHRSPHLSIYGLLSMIILAGILLPWVQGKLEDKGAPGIARGTHTKGKLRYEAVPKSKEIALGGTIWMNLKLINDGSTSVTLFWGDYAYEDQYRFDIEHAGAKIAPPAKRFMPPFSILNPKHFVTIAPGGNAAYTLCLTAPA